MNNNDCRDQLDSAVQLIFELLATIHRLQDDNLAMKLQLDLEQRARSEAQKVC